MGEKMQGDNPNPAPAQPAQPVAEAAPSATPLVDNGGAAPLVQGGKGASKGLIIGIICGVVAIVLIVCGIIFIPMLFSVDYKEAYSKSTDAKDAILKINNKSCGDLRIYVSSTSKTTKSYKELASKCKNDISSFKSAYEALSKNNGVSRNEKAKEHFEKAKTSYEKISEKLDKYPEYMVALHDFKYEERSRLGGYISTYTIKKISSSDVDAITKSLTSSNFDNLKKFGEDYNKALKKVVKAYQDYDKASGDYSARSKAYEAFNDAKDEYNDLDDKYDSEKLKGDYNDDFDDELKNVYDELSDIDNIFFKESLNQD